MKTSAIFTACALLLSTVSAQEPLTLTVNIVGAEPNTGSVVATLFDSEKTYVKSPAAEESAAIDANGAARIVFEYLTAGEYAVSVVYDKNGNGKLDTNFLGIPKEKIGFSNNARPNMGPAPYRKARFELSADNSTIEITLGKAKRD